MTEVVNVSPVPVSLTGGRVLAPGEAAADVEPGAEDRAQIQAGCLLERTQPTGSPQPAVRTVTTPPTPVVATEGRDA